MGPRNDSHPTHDFGSESSKTRYRLAKRRVIDRLSRLGATELRGESRAAGMLTWSEIVDFFIRRARMRSPKKRTFAHVLMNLGLRLGRSLDRLLGRLKR